MSPEPFWEYREMRNLGMSGLTAITLGGIPFCLIGRETLKISQARLYHFEWIVNYQLNETCMTNSISRSYL